MKKFFAMISSAICLAACVMGGGCASADVGTKGTAMNETFFNPIRATGNDPWLYYHDGYYYYCGGEGGGVCITKSKYMTQVVRKSDDETVTKVVARASDIGRVEIWAPEVFFFEDHWYTYFTATIQDPVELTKDTNRRTYGARSKTDDAMGEWDTPVEIKLPCDYRSIDATFMDYNGRQYIVWSGWPRATNNQWWQDLYITELETGNPLKAKSTDPKARVLVSTPTYSWETFNSPQNEGPAFVVAPDGTPLIFYAASYSGGDMYAIGYVTLTGDMDPMKSENWEKGRDPLMSTDTEYAEIVSPGHCSVVKSPDDSEYWICYHSAKYGGGGWDRMSRLQKMSWKDGHVPVVEQTARYSEEIALPAGEKVNRIRYEAEDAETENCQLVKATDEWQGKEYDRCSGGQYLALGQSGSITYKVKVPESGEYLLSVRYANPQGKAEKLTVDVNYHKYDVVTYRTDYEDLFTLNFMFVDLREGINTITITCEQDISLDCIVIDYLNR